MSTAFRTPTLEHDKMMKREFGREVSPRGKLERRIVANLCEHMRLRGFNVASVFDGEEDTPCADTKAAMELIFNLDEASLRFVKPGHARTHGVYIVLGNGIDCIADWNYTKGDPDGFNAAMEEFDVEQFA